MTTTNSGEGKLERAISQLEKSERLLGGLPGRMFQPDERKIKLKELIKEISRIEDELKKLYKDELEKGTQ